MGGVGSGRRSQEPERRLARKTIGRIIDDELKKKIKEGSIEALLELTTRLQVEYLDGVLSGNQVRTLAAVIAIQRTIINPVDMNRRTKRILELREEFDRPKSTLELRDTGPPGDDFSEGSIVIPEEEEVH